MSKRIVYDKSVYGATRAGVYVFAKGVLHALKKEGTLEIIEFDNPFSTIGKCGIARKFSSLCRLLYSEFITLFYRRGTVFFFPAPEMSIFVAFFKFDFIITIHDLFTWKNTDKTTFFARFRQRLLPYYARRAKYVLTVSEYSKSEIVDLLGIDPDKVIICHNGLPEKTHKQVSVIGFELNAIYFPYILFIGSSEPRKNLKYLIEVFDAVNKSRSLLKQKLVTLVMTCGETWTNDGLAKRIATSPYKNLIVTTGHVSEIEKEKLYEGASVTVLPSLAEGFGIPVIESLSHGTPVIVQKNTALSMFSEYGALVMDDFDAELWAKNINDMINNHVRVSNILVDKVVFTFSWSRSVLDILRKLK